MSMYLNAGCLFVVVFIVILLIFILDYLLFRSFFISLHNKRYFIELSNGTHRLDFRLLITSNLCMVNYPFYVYVEILFIYRFY